MTAHYMDLLFTDEVMRQQDVHGSRDSYARMAGGREREADFLGPKEAMFLSTRDSFYIASTSASGWPYVQHRGGPSGFVKLLGDRQIGFADYRGNRQYVSLGNVATDDRVALFFMDYVRRARLKMLGRMRAVALIDNPDLAASLTDEAYGAKVERGFVIDIEAYDWNCPQHITPRYTQRDIAEIVAPLQQRIVELEAISAKVAGESL
jgi:uncharacterized protein